jgi:hypothetical protein
MGPLSGRRREAEPNHPEAARALAWIGELYAIVARAEGDLELKAKLRRTESTQVLEAMKSWLWQQASLKTLSIGNAAATRWRSRWRSSRSNDSTHYG